MRNFNIYWNFDYETASRELYNTTGKENEHLQRSIDKAMEHFNRYDNDDFIVIRVEGYSCVALVTNDFTPIEVHQDIFPYDSEQTFPMQGLKIEARFMTFHECISEL